MVCATAFVGVFIARGGSDPTNSPFALDSGSGGDTTASDDSGQPNFAETSIPEAGPLVDGAVDCPPSAKLIDVTGVGAQLWSFWPPTFTFKKIGTLNCTIFPTHMTVATVGALRGSWGTAGCSARRRSARRSRAGNNKRATAISHYR